MVEEPSHVKQLSLNQVCKIPRVKYLDIDKTAFRGLFLSSCSLAGSDVFWPEMAYFDRK
jgi:hypothetical protein